MPILFVEADEPLLVFPSVEMAARYMEAVDVRNGVYPRAFGPSGEQFSIAAVDEFILIEPADAPPDPAYLESLLRRVLKARGAQPSDAAGLPELVAAASRMLTT